MPRGGLYPRVFRVKWRIGRLWTRHNPGDLDPSAVLAEGREIT